MTSLLRKTIREFKINVEEGNQLLEHYKNTKYHFAEAFGIS